MCVWSSKMIFLIVLCKVILAVYSNSIVINNSTLLEEYLCNHVLMSETELIITSSIDYEITVDRFCMVQNITNVVISSDSPSTQVNIVCRHSKIGLGFFNAMNLMIQGIVFIDCGAEISLPNNVFVATNESILHIGPHQRAVLFFSHCRNTSVTNLNIVGHFYGFCILSMNAFDLFKIHNLLIQNDHKNPSQCVQTSSNFSCSGSGLAFVSIETNFENSNNLSCEDNNHSCMYLFIFNVTIHNASNFYSYKNSFLDIYSRWNNSNPIVSGTGLTILLNSNKYSIISAITTLSISGSNASHAGGVLIFYCNTQLFHEFIMSDLHLENNSIGLNDIATSPAITCLFSSRYDQTWIANMTSTFNIQDSYFVNNKGYLGGGLLVMAPAFSHVNVVFYITTCTFVGNRVTVSGSAIHFGVSIMRNNDRVFSVEVADMNAHENSDLNGMYGVSVVSFSSAQFNSLKFERCLFTHNIGSAIEVYSTTVVIFRSFICRNNTSNKGSCLLLKGTSFIRFYKNVSLILEGNTALTSGGAIYSNYIGGPSDACTILPGGKQVSVVTNGNSALFDGNDMKISNLYNCTIFDYDRGILFAQDNFKFFLNFMNYHPKDPKAIVSRTTKLLICNPNISSEVTIYSGVTIQLSVMAVDAGAHPVYTTVTVSFYPYDNQKWRLEEINFYNIYSQNSCNNTLNITITVDGIANRSNGFLVLMVLLTEAMDSWC